MELENYRNFLAVVDAGSFTAAAELVHVAQPALSRQLKALERFYGTRLIITQRGSKQLVLTEAGHILYQKAKYMCSLEGMARLEIDKVADGAVGTLRISAANSRSALFISSALKDFSRMYPLVTYEIYEGGISDQVQQLLSGLTELGIFSVPLTHEDRFQLLFRRREELSAVFHRQSPWLEDGDEITLEKLEKIPLSVSAGCCDILKRCCAERGLLPAILSISTTRSTALQWAAEGAAAAVVPAEPDEVLGEQLVKRRINTGSETNLFKTVVKVKDRPLSVVARKFLEFYARTRNSEQVCDLQALMRREQL